MGSFDPFIGVVTNLMNRFGTMATILVASAGEYDASTSTYQSFDTPYQVKAIAFDLTKLNNGQRSIPSTLIEEGDKQFYIQPTAELPVLQPNKDTLILNGITYKIFVLKQVNTTMANCILYEAYCRV